MDLTITKRDGTREPFNANKINESIERACIGMSDPISMVTQIATETRLTLYDGITTEEMDQATINAAVQNIQFDIEYDKVATRLLLKTVYRRVIGEYNSDPDVLRKVHKEKFVEYIKRGVEEKLLDKRMIDKFDLEDLAAALEPERDELFLYAGLSTLLNRYAIKNVDQTSRETPQFFFMRVAMGLAYNEEDPTLWAKKFYKKMSKLEYLAGGSTNLGAGTVRPALSNCYLLEMHDEMEHIAKSVSDVLKLSKGSGGIGASITRLRASGSPLSSSNTLSSGPTPFAKVVDTAIRAVQRGGKKKGALCFYMENWHLDFPDFLHWKHNAGDDYLRMRTANTAVFMSDEFMKRVKDNQDWYMFDPKETTDLNDLYGRAFSKRYGEYIQKAEKGEMRVFKKVPAVEQYRQILVSMQTTSHPWLTWKDPINLRALNNNTGTIHMSNLCTEICLPQDKDNVAVCNLTSINLAAHIGNKEVNWMKLEESARLAVRQIDNLIDINELPIPEATKSDHENRAMGIGVMGFADSIEKLGMPYDSKHAWDFADRMLEFISYMAIDESANLARERGSYQNFEGSGWSKGKVPIDTIEALEKDRGMKLDIPKDSKHGGLDWDVLRTKVKEGMRNSTLMAVAPNANIGLVGGTTPGIDARFSQVFARNKISGKYLDINHNLVKDLKNLGIWTKTREKIVENQGDISDIEEIPQHIRDIYKTSFTTSPYAYIEVAARAQKWVDQALSRNIYLETRDIDETMDVYSTAWAKGVKTTYYLHMKPRHTAEQSTISVNKSKKMGRKGFAGIADAVSKKEEVKEKTQPAAKGFGEVAKEVEVEKPATVEGVDKPVQDDIPSPVEIHPSNQEITEKVPVETRKPQVNKGFGAVASPEPVSEDPKPAARGFAKVTETSSASAGFASTETRVEEVEQKPSGFNGGVKPNDVPNVCPVDPAERSQCDSCQ